MSPPVGSKEIPYLRNIGLLMTYRCQIACSHCIIEAGPHRKEEILFDDASDWIKQISEYNDGHIKFLSLTGGEPFYNINNLKEISALGDNCGLIISAVTNAFWASTPQKANKVLKGLSAIKLLAISTDVHHQESVPIEWVKNAVLSAEESNIPCNVCLCTENEDDKDYIKILKSLEGITEKDNIKTVITFPAGRYLQKKKDFKISNIQRTSHISLFIKQFSGNISGWKSNGMCGAYNRYNIFTSLDIRKFEGKHFTGNLGQS